jgi:hypothetical protein
MDSRRVFNGANARGSPRESGLSDFDQKFGLRHCKFCFFNNRAESFFRLLKPERIRRLGN